MSIFGNTVSKRKSDVPEPKGTFLVKGLIFPAIGMVGFTVAGLKDMDPMPRLVAEVAGILFCILGVIHIFIYFLQLRSFHKYIPKGIKAEDILTALQLK